MILGELYIDQYQYRHANIDAPLVLCANRKMFKHSFATKKSHRIRFITHLILAFNSYYTQIFHQQTYKQNKSQKVVFQSEQKKIMIDKHSKRYELLA